MVFENIEKLKSEYTDKYVIVDASLAELRRFRNLTGVVKTVNMNGRALVEFLNSANNIGWFDIDVDFLKVVDKPVEAPEKPAAKAAPKPAAPAKKPAASGGGMSPADILAAARGGASAPKPAAAKPAGMSAADILAAARGGSAPANEKPAAPKPAAADSKSMSVDDILAAARGGSAAPAAKPEPVADAPAAADPPAQESKPEPAGDLPTNVADILAFCRQRDS
ncbi:MAG: hypothetical protein R3C28_15685 [Pirellulaceae bacterium]